MVTELYPPTHGGSAVLFREIYSRLGDLPVRVLTNPHERREGQDGPTILEHPVGTTQWGVTRPGALLHHLKTSAVLRRLARKHTAVAHCGRALPEGLAAWLGRMFGGPRYICWAHGEDLATALTSRELTFLTTRIYAGAELAVANSRNTAQMLRGFGVPSERLAIVYPGVDAGRFSPAVDGSQLRKRFAPSGELVLLSVGRLQRRKGHDLTLRAMAVLRSVLPSLRYVIAGDGEERASLERLAAEMGVSDCVHFAGAFPAEDLPALYSACDIFVLPNRIDRGDIEGFGIVFLEAASVGKPVIGGNSGGVPEAVADGLTGFLVSGTDVQELADAVTRLARDPHLRQRMGSAGRQRVLESFTWDRAARAIGEIHRRATGARSD